MVKGVIITKFIRFNNIYYSIFDHSYFYYDKAPYNLCDDEECFYKSCKN